jgi:hypothetical protein
LSNFKAPLTQKIWNQPMSQSVKEAYGPRGDTSRHLPRVRLESGLGALRAATKDSGELLLIVTRRADGVRETPSRFVDVDISAANLPVGSRLNVGG